MKEGIMKIIIFIMLLTCTVLIAVPQTELDKTDALHDANEYETELMQLEELSVEFPEDVEVLWRLAQVHFDIADQTEDEAVHKAHFYPGFKAAKKAVKINPHSARANHWYATLIGKIGMLEGTKQKIINSYDVEEYGLKAIELDPTYDGSLHLMGRWHYELADLSWIERTIAKIVYETPPKASFEESVEFYNKAIDAKPDEVRHYLWIGKALIKLTVKEEAKKYLQTATEMTPLDDADRLMQKEAELLKKLK
jgi:tetratricopeptide (TPR) repeat protein